ncbi:glycosyltransferase [Alteromonas mediterranea]|uniref:Glycosyl transferase n=1 Tax=Alteromonas mediterranea TaxID=314275 RepID=A0AAC8XIR7_9ALTE|nr:glycosyltransferase [Alteromonas mediterranea]AFV84468.1 glycosyltransferase [Alteromonas mediterranea DE1]AGP96475.1 glycosyltransferase [Alteromonas mediterranea UM7]AGQ00811.1 glycosyltransferase [Alteromonas mediterranea UM4b]AMJ77654.1 glycosyl transferase [Alteromonas mediterranea]AMJ81799.1 glycosyl transferase [Alteromonas mediterranea]
MINQFSILHNKNKKQHVESIVAMAVYQADNAKWLREAIDSITKQTYTNFLFVIVIDGPVPQAISGVLNDAVKRDDRIILAQNSHNIGLASCMNAVIDFSMQFKPTFFVRMDADDISEEHRLLRQITYLKRHSNISVLGSALTEINESGFKVGARVMPASHKQIVRILPRRCSLNHPTVVIRYNVFNDGHRYNGDLLNTQDYFFWITLASKGYIFRNLKDRLLKFRRVNNFYKRRGLSKSLNEFKARVYAITKLKQFSPYNFFYACGVLSLRLMPGKIVKLAYKLDRHLLERFGKH